MTTTSTKRNISIAILLLLIIPTGIFYQSLHHDFVNWDDNGYVTSNPDLAVFQSDDISVSLSKTFSSFKMGNYHPVTMLSYAIDFYFFEWNAKGYHATNLLLHLLNTLLVFYFILLLSKELFVAFITALLFAIHPMHVESVVWVSERKDLLYTFFYLGALCSYLFYLRKEDRKSFYYLLTLLLFVLSLLSKGMAVSLSVMLFALDYFLGRKISKQTISEKVPFILLSLTFGVIAIVAQQQVKALDIAKYNFFERILFSCYGLVTYLWKIILPINQSCYYAYPDKINGFYPPFYYIMPLLIIALGYVFYKFIKGEKKYTVFGVSFFMISILLVLQILPAGSSIISERYTYIPYTGLFFIAARGINANLNTSKKIVTLIILTIYLLALSIQSFKRVKVWKDTTALWTDAIEKDNDYPFLYDNRASNYYVMKEYDKALADFNAAVNLGYLETKVYYKRGTVLYTMKRYKEAIADFDIAIKENTYDSIIFYQRGYAYSQMGRYREAIADYNTLLQTRSKFVDAYHDRGLVYFYAKDYEKAIADFTKAIALKPDYAVAYLSRGSVLFTIGNVNEAIIDYSKAIHFLPNYAEAYYNRAIAYLVKEKFEDALNDILKAKELGHNVPNQLMSDIQARNKKKIDSLIK